MRSKRVVPILKCSVGFIVLAYVVITYWEPDESTGVGLKSALLRSNRWEYFFAAFLCLTTCTIVTFIRWYGLVRAQGLPFTLRDAFRLGLIGYFFNTLLPGSVGGDLLKAAFIAREQKRRTLAISTILIDRGVGLWGLIALAALVGSILYVSGHPALVNVPDLVRVFRVSVVFMAVTLSLWLFLGALRERRALRFQQRLLWIPKLGPILAEFWKAVWLYRKQGKAVLGGLAMTMIGHVFTVFSFYFAAMAFQARSGPPQLPGLLEHFVIVPAGMAFQGFFPSPGGIGGGEFIFGLIYSRIGQPAASGIWGSFAFRMNSWLLGLLGYLVYSFMKNDLQRPLEPAPLVISTNSNVPDRTSSTTQV
jgi:uncharacterized protein (TIRG00374 family)